MWKFFYLLIFFSAAVAAAPDRGGAARPLSLHEAVTRTLSSNPELRSLDYQLKAQEGRVQQAAVAPTPELIIELEDALGSGEYTGVKNAQATVSIGWVIERGVRQRYIDAARAGSALVILDADIKRLDAAAETARRYLESLAWQTRMTVADQSVRLAEETLVAMERLVKAARTTEMERARARADLARRKLEREDTEHELLSANRRLAAQWGATTLDFARVEGDILTLPIVASLESLESQLQQTPEFARLLSERRLKQAELDLALAQERPHWRVNAGVRRLNVSGDQAFVAGVTIPIGEHTRNPGRIAEARAHFEKMDLEESARRVRSETALYVLYEKLQHSLHVIKSVRGEIIPPLEQALTETRRAYALGRYSYLELRTIQAELLEAHDALIEASIDAHQTIIEIERLTGVRIAQPATTP